MRRSGAAIFAACTAKAARPRFKMTSSTPPRTLSGQRVQPIVAASSRPAPALGAESLSPGAFIACFYLFLLVSRLTEFVDTQQRFHLVLIAACAAVIGAIATLCVGYAFNDRIGLCLGAFTAWVIFELPFSSWRGGSFHALTETWIKSYLTYIVIAALLQNFRQLKAAVVSIALGTACIVLLAFKYGQSSTADDRFYFVGGSLANSNDLAMILLLGLPFLLYVFGDKRRSWLTRIPALLTVPVALDVVLKTGSRASLIAFGVMAAVFFFRTNNRNRVLILLAAIIVAGLGTAILSKSLLERYSTILSGRQEAFTENDVTRSAAESEEIRRELMLHALIIGMKHPIFGVGLNQFQIASADISIAKRQTPIWRTVHSFVLLVFAETGIPGLIFYLSAMYYCLRALIFVSRAIKRNPELGPFRPVNDVFIYSSIGFIVCMIFNTDAYLFHFPLMAALISCMQRFTKQTLAGLRNAQATASLDPRAGVGMGNFSAVSPFLSPGRVSRPISPASPPDALPS